MSTDDEIRAKLQPRSVVALTLYAEGSSAPIEARIAIGGVIRNRRKTPGAYRSAYDGYDAICWAPAQFSCWNGGDANYARLMAQAERVSHALPVTDVVLHECFWIADGIMEGVLLDRSKGATYYMETQLYDSEPPRWAKPLRRAAEIGPFTFLAIPPKLALT